MMANLKDDFVSAWSSACRTAFADPRDPWKKNVNRTAATEANLRACLDIADQLESGRFSLVFTKRSESIEHLASDLCSRKNWHRHAGEFLRLDFSILDRGAPTECALSAELENNSISLESKPETVDFLHNDAFGLSDFTKLLAAPSRIRLYIGRTMSHGKATKKHADTIKEHLSSLVANAVARGRLHASDYVLVLLVRMRETRKEWDTYELDFDVGQRLPEGAELKWERQTASF